MHKIIPASIMAGQAAVLRLTEEEIENERGCGCPANPPSRIRISTIPQEEGPTNTSDALCIECEESMTEHCTEIPDAVDTVHTGEEVKLELADSDLRHDELPLENLSASSSQSLTESLHVDTNKIVIGVSSALDDSLFAQGLDESSPIERLLLMKDAIMKVVEGMKGRDHHEVCECLVLLSTIIGNARNLPDQKYQSIKIKNKKFERLVQRRDGAVQILEAAGFAAKSERMVLSRNDPGLLYLCQSLVDMAVGVIEAACNDAFASVSLLELGSS